MDLTHLTNPNMTPTRKRSSSTNLIYYFFVQIFRNIILYYNYHIGLSIVTVHTQVALLWKMMPCFASYRTYLPLA